jgi:predicted acyltransferase
VLGVFPAIAQGLIGVLAGSWMRRRGPTAAAAGGLVLAGLVCLVAGLAWSTVFPPVKALWTSSFVLISSGAPLILLGFFWWALDIRRIKLPGLVLLMAFGVNAIFAYVLHEVGSVILEWPIFQQLLDAATPLVGAQAAALAPVGLFVALVWIPLVVMYRRGWIVRI